MPRLPARRSSSPADAAGGTGDPRGVLRAVDRITDQRYPAVVELVEQMRARRRLRDGREPDADAVVDEIVKRYSRELGTVAALTGGAAALPGTGTAAAVLATGADLAYTMGKLGEMVVAIGLAYGHDASSIDERRAWVLAVLSMGKGAVVGIDGLAGRVGQQGGARLVEGLGASQLDAVNSKLAAKMLSKVASEQAAARLGRVLPFGIGAGVGAAGNVLVVRSVAKAAKLFFAPPPPGALGGEPGPATGTAGTADPAPRTGIADDDVIDVEVIDET